MNVETMFLRHYRECWGDIHDTPRPAPQGSPHLKTLVHYVARAQPLFDRAGLTACSSSAYFALDASTANGHAFFDGASFRPWFSLDSAWTEQQAKVFTVHELTHAHHYSWRGEFYFSDRQERTPMSRQLITEGLATFTSKVLLQIDLSHALWADYLPQPELDRWMEDCERSTSRFAEEALTKWDACEEAPFTFSGLADPWQNRGGYYLGALVVARISDSQQLKLRDLFVMERSTFERLALIELESLARNR